MKVEEFLKLIPTNDPFRIVDEGGHELFYGRTWFPGIDKHTDKNVLATYSIMTIVVGGDSNMTD